MSSRKAVGPEVSELISFTSDRSSFELGFRGRTIFTHAQSAPFLSLAGGQAEFIMDHGNFSRKDRILNRIQCTDFQIVEKEPADSGNGFLSLSLRFGDAVTVRFSVTDGRLHLFFSDADPGLNRMWLRFESHREEHFYGCGEQYSYLDMKGRRVPLWVEEQGVGRSFWDPITHLLNHHSSAGGSWYSTYFPQPTFVSSDNWFMHLDSSAYSEFDFRKTDAGILHVHQIPRRVVVDVQDSPVTTLGSLSEYLGRQPVLPDWVYNGMWLGLQGGIETVRKKLEKAKKAGIQVSGLWVQDWEGRRITAFGKQLFWNWKYHKEMYPDLPAHIAELKEEGVRFLGYINPFLAIEGDLYAEASPKGYCVKKADGEDYLVVITTFPAAIVDLTNPEAREWIKGVIKEHMIGIGLSGWMADFGEYLPTDAVLHSGESAEIVHNRFPALWAQVNREAVEEAGAGDDVRFFMRAGYTGSSRYATAIWAGDQLVNWSRHDGLASVIPAAISAGFSGIGVTHSDLGGYTTLAWVKRGKELFMRWAEHSVFTPLMRTHEGNRPDDNWQFDSDEETMRHLARMTRIYSALSEYHKAALREYVETGLPPIRHPYIHYPEDQVLHGLRYQYLYGRDLMVAPVIAKNRKRWKVYLPDDRWVHIWSGKESGGGWCTVDAPLGEPPVFYRKDSEFTSMFEGLKSVKEESR